MKFYKEVEVKALMRDARKEGYELAYFRKWINWVNGFLLGLFSSLFTSFMVWLFLLATNN